jgi:integrase/recombinase XerD
MPRKGQKGPPKTIGDPTDPHGFGVLSSLFFEWMRVRNYSERTVENRQNYLRYFVLWCGERGIVRPAEVSKAILERYQRWLYHYRKENGQPLTFGSQFTHLVPVRAFFKWCARQNHTLYNPASELDMPKMEKRLPKHVLTASEADRVLNQANVADPLGVRDRAILETFYSTGMRRSELASLKLYDLDIERGTVMIRLGKGKKDRMIPIGSRALAWIDKYVVEVRPTLVREPDDGTLFLSNLNEAFTRNRLTQMVREYIDAAQLGKRGSCHLFRHTMATLMLENGADIRFIQQMLGHAELSTTQIYTQVSIRKLKEIHSLTHPARLEAKPPPNNGEQALPADAATVPNGAPVNGEPQNQMLLGFAEQARQQQADALLSTLAAEPDNDSGNDGE